MPTTKEFTFKTNAWHIRFMNYVWGYTPADFDWMCVYFWLSLFTVVFSPVIVLFKLIIKFIVYCLDKAEERRQIAYEKWEKEYITKLEFDDFEQKKLIEMNINLLKNRKYSKALDLLWFVNRKLHKKLTQAQNDYYYNNVRNKQIKKMACKDYKPSIFLSRKEQIIKIYKLIKPIMTAIVWILGVLLAGIILFGVYKGILVLSRVPHKTWIEILGRLGVMFGSLISIFIICYLLNKINKEKTNLVFSYIAFPFCWIWCHIVGLFKLIGFLISDNCPRIIWEDKSKK